MGNSSSRIPGEGISKKELERMHRRFQRLSNGTERVGLAAFQTVPELAGNPFVPRIFQLFDVNKDGNISWQEFTAGVEYLGKLSTDEEKSMFAFQLYDLDANGFVSANELFQMLKLLMGRALSDAQLDQIVRSTVAEHDEDGDGQLSPSEFSKLLSASDLEHKLAINF
ncbi:hypothetical protein WJX72_007199 [[Myrmecia] bisecta]|uniref:EF-hand domain-containing protein n=1 Tax=[Myrmecia] bisecta TaxID=41462 RepID=A0AAW1QFJ9_9CHLO